VSTVIHIKPGQVGETLRKKDADIQNIVRKACRGAAMKLRTYLMKRTDDLKITDRGTYKNSFAVHTTRTGASVTNNAPHAGIVELGARPHKVSREGIDSIQGWVKRKLGIKDEAESRSIAWAIAKTIELEGQEPRYVMRDALPYARAFYNDELARLSK
jgi:hypothetical protein